MQFTKDQEKAVINLNKWWNSSTGDRNYTLEGSAGCGKTFLIVEWLRSLNLREGQVVVLAPTNKAAKVVRKMFSGTGLEIVVSTIHSALGMFLAEGEGSLKKKGRRVIKDSKSTLLPGEVKLSEDVRLIIVDEVSMVDQMLEASLKNAAVGLNSKVLWVGDSYQLKPPGKKQCGAFERKEKSTLTEVVRYSGGSLKIATKLREVIDKKQGKVPLSTMVSWQNSSDVENKNVHLLSESEWLAAAEAEFLEDVHGNVMLSYRNSKVVERNQFIRDSILNDTCSFVVGERLMCLKPLNFFQGGKKKLWKNGESLEVVEVQPENRIFNDFLGNLTKSTLEDLTLDCDKFFGIFNSNREEAFKTTILNIEVNSLDSGGYTVLEIVDPEVIQDHEGLFEDLVDRHEKLDFFYRVRYLVEDYLNCKEPRFPPPSEISIPARDLTDEIVSKFGGDYTLALASLRQFFKLSKAKYREFKAWKKLKYLTYDINYAYAMTTHKSQGSTYKNVFLDGEDIMSSPQWASLMYVALTRASNNVYIKK